MTIGQRRTAERIQIGVTLKRMRKEAKISREIAGDALGCTVTTISNIEQGRTRVSHGDLRALLELYGAPVDQVEDLVSLNRAAHRALDRIPGGGDIQPHQRRVGDLVKAARRMDYYCPEAFHGLLQEERYARAIMAPTGHSSDALEHRLRFRLGWAEVLTRTEQPLELWSVVGEAALRKNIGGPEVMAAQLRHVVALCRELPNVTVQVLPLVAREHYFIGATVTVYTFDGNIPEIATVDTTLGDHFLERSSTVAEAITSFNDVRAKALDPLTSVDMMETLARQR